MGTVDETGSVLSVYRVCAAWIVLHGSIDIPQLWESTPLAEMYTPVEKFRGLKK